MRYGFVLPGGDARTAADLAHEAEQAGWDGCFVWEPVWGIDAWVSLTAAAMRTERILPYGAYLRAGTIGFAHRRGHADRADPARHAAHSTVANAPLEARQ